MNDPRKKKQRNLRKAFAGGDRPCLYKMYDYLHPSDSSWFFRYRAEYRNERDHWLKKQIGVFPDEIKYGVGNAPAFYRRLLNRQLRAQQKQAIQNTMKYQDWENFDLPRFKRNVNWLWF